MQINWTRNIELIDNRELWLCSIAAASCPAIYAAVCNRLVESRGAFSFFYREDPFSGFAVDPDWDAQWRSSLVCEFETPTLYGYSEVFHRSGVKRPGAAVLRTYYANNKTVSMLQYAASFTDWQAPRPENFAAYDWKGHLVCYSIGHDGQIWFRRDLLFADLSRNLEGAAFCSCNARHCVAVDG
ncbi:MAG: hypothetical protein Aurels2KO_33300 [Aureliella sp.]